MAQQGVRPGGPGTQAGHRPVGVEIVNEVTGERLPCELAYEGIDHGLHVWSVSTPIYPDTEKVTVAVFPPKTTLTFDVVLPGAREEDS